MRHPARSFSVIEPLEARIAPALLVAGANLLGGSAPKTGESSAGANSVTLVKVLSGQAIVWYDGQNIVGISVGANTSLDITGDVFGDIIANLGPNGRLTDSDNDPSNGEDGGLILANNLLNVKVSRLGDQEGSVGNIITGGSVANVNISGHLEGIYTGNGVFDVDSQKLSNGEVEVFLGGVDFNPIEAGTQSTFTFAQGNANHTFLSGAGVTKATIGEALEMQIIAGDGLAVDPKFAAGGSIKDITITKGSVPINNQPDAFSYFLKAGDGSNGQKGGAGGSVERINEITSAGNVIIKAGNGGNATKGAGGAGGDVALLDLQSDSSNYLVTAGNGGIGSPGGAGGSARSNSFLNRLPTGGLLVTGDFTGDGADDIVVIDRATGSMQLQENDGTGTLFIPRIQYFDDNLNPVTLISSEGSTPVDAKAVDVDGNGTLDLVVLYQSSSTFVVYYNQADDKGSFYNEDLGLNGRFDTLTTAVAFKPTKFQNLDGSLYFAVAGDSPSNANRSVLALYTRDVLPDLSGFVYKPATGLASLDGKITALTGHDDRVFVGKADGAIIELERSSSPTSVFNDLGLRATIRNGVTSLDYSASSTANGKDYLLAVSDIGRSVSVFEVLEATTYNAPSLITLPTGARPLDAHFVPTGNDPSVLLLTSLNGTSQVSLWSPVADATAPNGIQLTQTYSLSSAENIRVIAPLQSLSNKLGFAALTSSLNQFLVKDAFTAGDPDAYGLPFATKKVTVSAGRGGDGLAANANTGVLAGAGGAGGSISGIAAAAVELNFNTGDGGQSFTSKGGAGGSISNPVSFTSGGGAFTKPALEAETKLTIVVGNGGSPTDAAGGKKAAGGAGGSISGLALDLRSGTLSLVAGNGGVGRGGAAGAGGSISNIAATSNGGDLIVAAGDGGDAFTYTPLSGPTASAAAGAGGLVNNFTYTLSLTPDLEGDEKPYTVQIEGGDGGNAVQAVGATGVGGAGGSLSNVKLTIDPPHTTDFPQTSSEVDAGIDSTLAILVQAGAGGAGGVGGVGGSITGFDFTAVHDQRSKENSIFVNSLTLTMRAGSGGEGLVTNGGAGGSITLSRPISGISFLDDDASVFVTQQASLEEYVEARTALKLFAGDGGQGRVKGGAGGSITGLVAQNSALTLEESTEILATTMLRSALLHAGDGGDGGNTLGGEGGKGGSVLNSLIGARNLVSATAGDGGAGYKGGLGGSIVNNEFGLVRDETLGYVGMPITAGDGGTGVIAGGAGGTISNLRLNSPQSPNTISAILTAGEGGNAAANGVGGKGGDVSGVTQAKDVNSTINAIYAGSGGDGGTGGKGGNVLNIRTVGFLGRSSSAQLGPLGVFDIAPPISAPTPYTTPPVGPEGFAQGVFAGVGGTGSSPEKNGLNGALTGVTARQIAAIAAYNQGVGFYAAASISNLVADLVGFDADRGTGFAGLDGVYNNADNSTTRPTTALAINEAYDGFMWATTYGKLTVPTLAARSTFKF